jgi:hypothetical protein
MGDRKFLRLVALPVAKYLLPVESGSIYPGSSAESTFNNFAICFIF